MGRNLLMAFFKIEKHRVLRIVYVNFHRVRPLGNHPQILVLRTQTQKQANLKPPSAPVTHRGCGELVSQLMCHHTPYGQQIVDLPANLG